MARGGEGHRDTARGDTKQDVRVSWGVECGSGGTTRSDIREWHWVGMERQSFVIIAS
jgi:hypothetical protein